MSLHIQLLRCTSPAGRDAFHGVLLRDTAAIAATIPGIRHYTVNAVHDATHRLRIPAGPYNVDAITHMWFDDGAAADKGVTSDAYRALSRLLAPLLQGRVALDVEQRPFVTPPAEPRERGRLLKRMSILRRAQALDAAAFQHTWKTEHGPRVAAHEGALRGYLQDGVLACHPELGPQLPPCDGLTELWFDDAAGMERVLPQSDPSTVTGNAGNIIASISTFLVREVQLF